MAKRTYKKRSGKKDSGTSFREQVQQEVTQKIVDAIEKGGLPPWRKPWSCDPNCGSPRNVVSKKGYRGVNPLILESTCMDMGFESRWWGTYKQWADLGGQVKRRPDDVEYWGTMIVYWQFKEFEDKEADPGDDGKRPVRKIPMLRVYTVFNLEQVDDPDGKLAKYMPAHVTGELLPDPNFAVADEVIKATGAQIEHKGNRAYYVVPKPDRKAWPKHTGGDNIVLPPYANFASPQDYYGTAFHELGHWSEVRTDWLDESYAMNELCAELTACFVAMALDLPCSDDLSNHTPYIKSWLEAMKGDPTFIFKASSQANKQCEHILKYSGHDEASQGKADEEPEENDKPKRRGRKVA